MYTIKQAHGNMHAHTDASARTDTHARAHTHTRLCARGDRHLARTAAPRALDALSSCLLVRVPVATDSRGRCTAVQVSMESNCGPPAGKCGPPPRQMWTSRRQGCPKASGEGHPGAAGHLQIRSVWMGAQAVEVEITGAPAGPV